MQLGTHVYETALRYSLSKEITRRSMLQDSKLHSHCTILHYVQTQLDMTECTFKLNSTNT